MCLICFTPVITFNLQISYVLNLVTFSSMSEQSDISKKILKRQHTSSNCFLCYFDNILQRNRAYMVQAIQFAYTIVHFRQIWDFDIPRTYNLNRLHLSEFNMHSLGTSELSLLLYPISLKLGR